MLALTFLLGGCSQTPKVAGNPGAPPQSSWMAPATDSQGIPLDIPVKPTALMMTEFAHLTQSAKDYDKARELYERALKLDKNYGPAYAGLASLHVEQNHPEEALAVIEHGLKRQPKAATIYNELGVVRAKQNQWDAAVAALQKATTLEPANPCYGVNLASTLVAAGQFDRGLELYLRWLPPAEAHYRLARALNQSGRVQDSVRELQLAVNADPTHPLAGQMLRQWETIDTVKQVGYLAPAN